MNFRIKLALKIACFYLYGCTTSSPNLLESKEVSILELWNSKNLYHGKIVKFNAFMSYDDFYPNEDRHFDLSICDRKVDAPWAPIWIEKKSVKKKFRKYNYENNISIFVRVTGRLEYKYSGLFSTAGDWETNQHQYLGKLIPIEIVVDESTKCEIRQSE